jgi:pyruvate/2-oxoacid:ferredoxin oxidoreductase alpha subunit
LDPADPRNLNQVTLADPRVNEENVLCHGYMELRYLLEEAIEGSRESIVSVDNEFGEMFGRNWGGMVWRYRAEDADVILLAAGSLASEATVAADNLRAQGCKAGVLGLRVYRPFPKQELTAATGEAKIVAVFDKSLSYGNEGPICSDLKSALYSVNSAPAVHGYIAGLGGRDVKARELVDAVKRSISWVDEGKSSKATEWINCRI